MERTEIGQEQVRDVVIVGAGPVGLFLACELGLAGCSVLVLEREAEPGSPWRTAPLGMRGLSGASIEAFHRRGLLEALRAASGPQQPPGRASVMDPQPDADPDSHTAPRPRFAGHFAGMVLDPADLDLDALPDRLPGPASDGMMMTYLADVESVLAARAAELGVEIRRGVPVSDIDQDDEGVVVRAGDQEFPGRWVVGCDGGRSRVRALAGFEFVGTDPRFTGYVMHVTVADPEKLAPGPFVLTSRGMYLRMAAEGHLGMMDFDGGAFDRSQPPTREHLQAVLRRVSGIDVTLTEVHRASTFTDRAMQATTYRRGRVLLAGDAAHIHSPLGGQGLNLGLGDAMNLGWKLAATLHGQAPAGLLDTYTAERHPIGVAVLDWSRAQVETMCPDPRSRALLAVVGDLLRTGDGTTYAFRRLSGSTVRYDLGDETPLVGRSVPEFRRADGTGLGELMRDGRAVLLDLSPDHRLAAPAARWADRVRYVTGPVRDGLGMSAVLVRPDGTVAWACGDDPAPGAFEAFERAAARWFAAPAGRSVTTVDPIRRDARERRPNQPDASRLATNVSTS